MWKGRGRKRRGKEVSLEKGGLRGKEKTVKVDFSPLLYLREKRRASSGTVKKKKRRTMDEVHISIKENEV